MTDQNSAPDGTSMLSTTLERENKELQQTQVRRINDTLKRTRRLAMEVDEEPGVYVESPGTTERAGSNGADDTEKFCIPEPDVSAIVTKAIDQAFHLIEKERQEFKPKKNSPVVKRWRLF